MGAELTLRVVSWNIDRPGPARLERRLGELFALKPDIALLQEVSAANVERLIDATDAHGVAAGCLIRPRAEGETSSRDRGCAILCFKADPVGEPSTLETHVAPERSVIWSVNIDGETVDVASFHQVAGSDRKWGRPAKRAVFEAISGWAEQHPRRAVFGIDANSPETDHPDVSRNVYFPVDRSFDQREYLLHDPARAPHRLRDAYRRHLDEFDPDALAAIRALRPSGPLAVSHVNRGRPRRFDFIFASPDLVPVKVVYREDLRVGANEHAPVVADFELA